MKNVLVLNGPNLNMLGVREKGIYGDKSYDELVAYVKLQADRHNICSDVFQSNHEGELVERIHSAFGEYDAIIINPAAFTHTSVAIRDALLSVNLPIYEVHLSNVHAREEFRHKSFVSDIAKAVICGCGIEGYIYALAEIARS